jgi:protein transport protein SEC31
MPSPCCQVAWSPQLPAIFASGRVDGSVSVHSFHDAKQPAASKIPSDGKIKMNSIAPKWLYKTCGATFGFGGKLVKFSPQQGKKCLVFNVHQEPELKKKAEEFDRSLENISLTELCENKV